MTPRAAYNSVKNLKAKLKPRENRGILEVFDNDANVEMFKHLFNSGVEKFKKDNLDEISRRFIHLVNTNTLSKIFKKFDNKVLIS